MFSTPFLNTRRRFGLLLAGFIIKQQQKRKHRSEHIRPIFRERMNKGEYDLINQLENDPFYHKIYFRMTKESFESIFAMIRKDIEHPIRHAYPIPAKLRLAMTLRYLATGVSQIQLALGYKVSPSSVTKIIREVLAALIKTFEGIHLPNPTHETWTQSETIFREKWNFPFCLGAIDGKHVRLRCPWKTGSHHYNYKGFFSVVVLAVVSGDYRFLVADIGAPGSESDAAIFTNTSFYKHVTSKSLQIPENGNLGNPSVNTPYVFVGDEAFPLKPWLMRPFSRNELELKSRIFNYRLSRARRVVENAFGIWAARWRILFTPIDADDDLVHLIIRSTLILHNFLRTEADKEVSGDEVADDGTITGGNWREMCDQQLLNIPRVGSNNYSMLASSVRQNFANYFSDEGRIDGQELYVMRT